LSVRECALAGFGFEIGESLRRCERSCSGDLGTCVFLG